MSTTTSTLAINGGAPAHTLPAPKYPNFDHAAFERMEAALADGPPQGLSKAHPIIDELETALARFHEVDHCLCANSGHGALQSALIGLEITDGDEVITPPYSWGASVSCILHNDAVPAFADVLPDTGLLDPARLEDALTPRSRAILVPHLYGQPADMTAIMAFAERHDLVVIEDGSQAHGARHQGRPVGSFGHASGFSTNGVKPLATTEGGYMVTRVADVYWKATISCQHAGRGELVGRASEPGFPDELRPFIDSLVYTYRPNILPAILILDHLPRVGAENAARRQNAAFLARHLEGVGSVRMPRYDPADEGVFHMITLNFDADHAGVDRDAYLAALQAEGVPAVAYVERGLHLSPRLRADSQGPRVMWSGALRRSGFDPDALELPGCEAKVAHSIEIPFNFPEVDEELMASLAGAFVKLEENLPELRRAEG